MARCILLLLLAHTVAWAELEPFIPQAPQVATGNEARARAHFEAGRGLYQLGNYADALREFGAGYSLIHRIEFLINIGQSYRGLGDLVHARELFARFLREAPPDHPNRAEVEELLASLGEARPSEAPQSTAAVVAASPVVAPRPMRLSLWRRPLPWVVIACAAVLVVGGAVAIGVASTHDPSSTNGTLLFINTP